MDKSVRRLNLSFRDTQPSGDVLTSVTANIKYQMDNGMAESDEGIIRLEFLDVEESDGGNIAFKRESDMEIVAEDDQFKGTPFIISSGLIVALGAFFTMRRRIRQGKQDEDQLEKGSFAEDDNDSDVSFEEVHADELYRYEYPEQLDVTPEKTSLARLYHDTGDEVELCRIPSNFSR